MSNEHRNYVRNNAIDEIVKECKQKTLRIPQPTDK